MYQKKKKIRLNRWALVPLYPRVKQLCFGATSRTNEDPTRKRCSVVPFAQNDRAAVPVVISLRRTIRGNRTWEEEARITLSVIFRSTALGTLANVFWNTRRAYLPWHEYHGVSFISPRCQQFYSSYSRSLPFSLSPLKRLVRAERKRSEIK